MSICIQAHICMCKHTCIHKKFKVNGSWGIAPETHTIANMHTPHTNTTTPNACTYTHTTNFPHLFLGLWNKQVAKSLLSWVLGEPLGVLPLCWASLQSGSAAGTSTHPPVMSPLFVSWVAEMHPGKTHPSAVTDCYTTGPIQATFLLPAFVLRAAFSVLLGKAHEMMCGIQGQSAGNEHQVRT